jgi:hypothetical protein
MDLINETALRDMIKSIVKEELAKTNSSTISSPKPANTSPFGTDQTKPAFQPPKPEPLKSDNLQPKTDLNPTPPASTYNSSSIASTPPASPAPNKNIMDTFSPSSTSANLSEPSRNEMPTDSTPAMGNTNSAKPTSSVNPAPASPTPTTPSNPTDLNSTPTAGPANPTSPAAATPNNNPTQGTANPASILDMPIG